jgi:hypothetical protein
VPPEELLYLWQLYCDFPTDVTPAELEPWLRLTGHALVSWEIEALFGLAKLQRKVANEHSTP